MLPKVATHIVHTTSRAATSIHQTQIRNVFQLQSSSGSSGGLAPRNTSAGSNWGSNGPGPGGSKHNTGSRFHYNGAGRAVTQASATVSANDGSFNQTEDSDDAPAYHSTKKTRIRSHSLSLSTQSRSEPAEKLGIFKTVQLHARSRHAFAPPSSSRSLTVTSSSETYPPNLDTNHRPVLVRRNSTSTTSPISDAFNLDLTYPNPSLSQTILSRNSTTSSPLPDKPNSVLIRAATPVIPRSPTDSSSPQTVDPPLLSELSPQSPDTALLNRVRDSGDSILAAEAVRKFCETTTSPSVIEFNAALEALHVTRRPGEPLYLLLSTYNDMLKHSVRPNVFTCVTLIDALTTRDREIQNLISSLEIRLKRHKLAGRSEVTFEATDRKRIENLRREDNFGPAMSIFSSLISTGGNDRCPSAIYLALLQSSAFRGYVDSAVYIFSQLEERGKKALEAPLAPSPVAYQYLIKTYTNGGQIKGAEDAFNNYLSAYQRGDIYEDPQDLLTTNQRHVKVWNQMIETYFRFGLSDMAVGLLEQMVTSKPGLVVPPPVAASTFTTLLSGFCQAGDVPTALVWFHRLLQQVQLDEDPYVAVGSPTKLDPITWSIMFDALATQGMIHDLNRLFMIGLKDSSAQIEASDRLVVFRANIAHLKDLDTEQFSWTMNFLSEHVLVGDGLRNVSSITRILEAYVARGMFEPATIVLVDFINTSMRETEANLETTLTVRALQHIQLNFTKQLYERSKGHINFAVVLQLARLADKIRIVQREEYTPLFLHSYGLSRVKGTLPIKDMLPRDWELLLYAALEVETTATQDRSSHSHVPGYAFEGIVSLLSDLSEHGVAFNRMNATLIQRVVQLVVQQSGSNGLKTIFQDLGPSFEGVVDNNAYQVFGAPQQALDGKVPEILQDSGLPSFEFNPGTKLRVDSYHTKSINTQFWVSNLAAAVPSAFAKFRRGIERGIAPSPATIGLLIQNLGRKHMMQELQYTYSVAQAVLQLLQGKKSYQTDAWYVIEDSMIIALAHHGDVDGAHIHRMRILEHGGSPTADAYGALVYNVKDTTNDASNAMALFNESQRQGVAPNQYLYNNIISKLSKARKADHVLELFQQMKATSVSPTSVTYGAVIGACARVGDVQSAESLFSEMVASKQFKPRVPPYNTMIQMYTTTKPNRERALYYYHELRKAKVSPTAHTYKLLMDVYGSIEPVDIQNMEQVFEQLQKDTSVGIQGSHFATLINAYGCVQKDLDKAIQVFNSIPSYHRAQAADAVVFESMFNALVANRRTDLIPEYLIMMERAGVHMTAYIANFLIKGYSLVGDMDQARTIFESLEDPPMGVAAPNNHTPHDPSTSPVIDFTEPVYREPSTWEAMVRAELGSGNRQRALELLERLRARQYPDAVYNRISGIMVDHSMTFP